MYTHYMHNIRTVCHVHGLCQLRKLPSGLRQGKTLGRSGNLGFAATQLRGVKSISVQFEPLGSEAYKESLHTAFGRNHCPAEASKDQCSWKSAKHDEIHFVWESRSSRPGIVQVLWSIGAMGHPVLTLATWLPSARSNRLAGDQDCQRNGRKWWQLVKPWDLHCTVWCQSYGINQHHRI